MGDSTFENNNEPLRKSLIRSTAPLTIKQEFSAPRQHVSIWALDGNLCSIKRVDLILRRHL